MKHIPYKGSVDVLSGALAGDVGVGPANMPASVTEVLSREVNGMVRIEDFRARQVKLGTEPRGDMSSAEIAAFIKSELGKWKQALDDSGAKAE